ncbi:LrgB family protein [Metabacillus sp. HB246100]
MSLLLAGLSISLTLGIYYLMKKIYMNIHHPLLVPIFTTSIILVVLLLLLQVPYEMYMVGGRWIDELLGPAVVALAIPLYDNRKMIRKNVVSIFISIFSGSIIGILSGVLLSVIIGLDDNLIASIAPKSVTTPIAMEISALLGGTPAIAAVYVMVAGISGTIFGPFLMRKATIHHPISIGIGFGTASHGIGTAKALELGTVEGALSSISLTLSAIFTSLLCPIIMAFL